MLSRFSVDAHADAVRDLAGGHLRTLLPERRGLSFDRIPQAVAAVERASVRDPIELEIRLTTLIERSRARNPALAHAAEVLRSANAEHMQILWEVRPHVDELESLGAASESLARLRAQLAADRVVRDFDDGVVRESAPALYDQWASQSDPAVRVRVADRVGKVADLVYEADFFGRMEPDDDQLYACELAQSGAEPDAIEREVDRYRADLRRMDTAAELRSQAAQAAAEQLSRPLTAVELAGGTESVVPPRSGGRDFAGAAYAPAIELWDQDPRGQQSDLDRDFPDFDQSPGFLREHDGFDIDDGPDQEVM